MRVAGGACLAETHPLTEDQFVNISGKHRTSGKDAAIRRRHHRRRYCTQPEKGNKIWCQVLQDQWQDHAGLRLREGVNASVSCLVPGCNTQNHVSDDNVGRVRLPFWSSSIFSTREKKKFLLRARCSRTTVASIVDKNRGNVKVEIALIQECLSLVRYRRIGLLK